VSRQLVAKTAAQGMRKDVSPARLDDDTAFRIRGAIQEEEPRMRPCWEGTSVDTVSNVSSVYPGLSTFTEANIQAVLGGRMYAWWDFSDSDNYTFAASAYSAVTDKSGNGYDLTVAGGDTGPGQGSDTPSGLKYGDFTDSATIRMSHVRNAAGPLDSLVNREVSVFAVYNAKNLNNGSGTYALLVCGDSSNATVVLFKHTTSNTTANGYKPGLSCSTERHETSGIQINDDYTNESLFAMGILNRKPYFEEHSTIDSVGGETAKLFLNEREHDQSMVVGGDADTNSNLSTITVGGRITGSDSMDMKLGEMIVTRADIGVRDARYIIQYLSDKWSTHTNAYTSLVGQDAAQSAVTAVQTDVQERIGAPWSGLHQGTSNRLAVMNKSGMMNVSNVSAVSYRGESGEGYLLEFGDYLVSMCDKTPIYMIHKSNITNTSETMGSNASSTVWGDAAGFFRVAGKGLFASHDWYDVGSADLTAANLTGTGLTNMTAANGWHGSTGSFDGTAGHMQISRRSDDFTFGGYPERGYWVSAIGNATLLSTEDFENTQENAKYRLAVPGQWAMGRMPFTYDQRLGYIEGREFETTKLFTGLASNVSASNITNLYIEIAADLSAKNITAGAQLVIDEAAVSDPILFDTATKITVNITGVEFNGSTWTRIYVDGGVPRTLENWWIRRKLSPKERRRVWYTGRPADTNNTISTIELQDPCYVAANNYDDDWGYDEDGPPTGVIQLGDRRFIVSQEKSLWAGSGEAPSDGISPPGYGITLLRRGAGLRSQYAWDFGLDRENIYFNNAVNGRMSRLRGATVTPIDTAVIDDADYSGIFSHVVTIRDRLYCLDTQATKPVIWVFNLAKGKWECLTKRENSGQDQTGTLAAVDPGLGTVGTHAVSTAYSVDDMVTGNSEVQVCTTAGTSSSSAPTFATASGATTTDGTVTWTCYSLNRLFEESNHGGLIAPFTGSGEVERALVAYKDGSGNYSLRTLNSPDDLHNKANLLHAGSIIPSGVNAKGYPVNAREMHVTEYRVLEDGSGNEYSRRRHGIGESEGESTGTLYRGHVGVISRMRRSGSDSRSRIAEALRLSSGSTVTISGHSARSN